MKLLIPLYFFFSLSFSLSSASAQAVDSIVVEISKERRLSGGPWDFLSMKTDSFGGGLRQATLRRNWNVNGWTNDSYDAFSYSGGLLTTAVTQEWDSVQWSNTVKQNYFHNASCDSIVSQAWDTAWTNVMMSIRYPGSNARDTLELTQQWRNLSWENFKKQDITYAPDSTFLSQTFSSWDTVLSQWNFNRRNLWFKDSLGNDTAYIIQDFVSGSWVNYYGIISYYTNGLLTEEYNYNWNDFDSSFSDLNSISTYTYDSLGRRIFDYIDGFPGGFGTNSYSYDSAGTLVNLLNHYETQGGLIHKWNTEWIFYSYPISSSIYLFAYDDTISICSNDSVPSVFFAIGGTPPLHFQWTPAFAVDIDTLENPYFIADSSALLTVTVTDAAANSVTDSVFLNVNQPPSILSVQSISSCIGCNNGMFVMNVTGGSSPLYFYSVQPSIGNIPLTDTISQLAPGIYTICLYDNKHCSDCVVDTIVEENVLVQERDIDRIVIYPNPSTGKFIIDHLDPSSPTEVVITNALGQEVSRAIYLNVSLAELEISSGSVFYFVNVRNGKGNRIYRVVRL